MGCIDENKVESVFYGVIMWAFLLTLFLFLAATGVRAGASGMVGLSGVAQAASAPGWQATARDAGVPQDLIEEWRRKAAANADSAARKLDDPASIRHDVISGCESENLKRLKG